MTVTPYTLDDLTRIIAKHNFCILAGQRRYGPHVAGMSYSRGLDFYIPTSVNTAKARNVQFSVFRRLLERADKETWEESIWIHVQPRMRIETFVLGAPSTVIFRDEKKAMLHLDVPP